MGPKRAKPIAIMVALGVALPCLLLSRGSPSAADTASRVGLAGTHAPPLFDASYGYLTRKDGTWTYPDLRLRNGQIAPDGGLTPDVVIPKIEDSGSHFVKVGRESAPDPEVAPYYDELHNQTPPLELGVRLNVRPEPSRRTLPDLLKRARHLRRSPTGCTPAPSASPCYYDWIFLDGAMLRSTKGLQRLIRGLRSNGPDGGGGWRLIMTNDTGWPGQGTKLARGEWAHAHSLGILHKPWDRRRKRHVTAIIRHHPRRVITDSDQEFIHEVRKRDPGSRPVLKFEVPTVLMYCQCAVRMPQASGGSSTVLRGGPTRRRTPRWRPVASPSRSGTRLAPSTRRAGSTPASAAIVGARSTFETRESTLRGLPCG